MSAKSDAAGRRNMNGGRGTKDAYAQERQDALIAGKLRVEELTMRELMKGRVTNEDGSFPSGRLPRLPQKVLNQMSNEVVRRARERVKRFGDRAMEMLEELAYEAESEQVRLGAIKLLGEYALGKPTENVVIKSADPWQDVIDEVLETERGDVRRPNKAADTGGSG